ncbi:hypothetical protein NUW54_g918 [Trametes sanguinea]|uniref:Uncharacterized protein n=1 Tax=Trametes sanguinea TaxID=158606 RepID=A0ACC1Q7V0_9APHY|nr:hypothetical protein NUW54_g918 [Trametes sanguinea]
MDHDYNEPAALALSDVVHDEPLPDDHQHHHLHTISVSSPSRPHSPPAPSPFQHQPSTHVPREPHDLQFLSSTPEPDHDHALAPGLSAEGMHSYTIEQLEREISSFLHHGNSATFQGAASRQDGEEDAASSPDLSSQPPHASEASMTDVERGVDALAGIFGLSFNNITASYRHIRRPRTSAPRKR